MKKIALLISLMTIISACSSTYFTEPQPSNQTELSSIPSELSGNYNSAKENITIESKSVKISSNGMSKSFTLGKDLIVKKEGLYYYFNMKNEFNSSSYWDVRIISINPTGFNIWSFDGKVNGDIEGTQVVKEKSGDQDINVVFTDESGFSQISEMILSNHEPQQFIRN